VRASMRLDRRRHVPSRQGFSSSKTSPNCSRLTLCGRGCRISNPQRLRSVESSENPVQTAVNATTMGSSDPRQSSGIFNPKISMLVNLQWI
jgi:hypothetical protein